MAFKLDPNLLIFATLVLLQAKLMPSEAIVREKPQTAKHGSIAPAADTARVAAIATASPIRQPEHLSEFYKYKKSRGKFVLDKLYSKLEEDNSGITKAVSKLLNSDKSAQKLWQQLDYERNEYAKGTRTDLLEEIWTELGQVGADRDAKSANLDLLVQMIDLVKEHLLGGPELTKTATTKAGASTGSEEAKLSSIQSDWCRAKERAIKMNSLLELFSFNKEGKLYKSLLARAMDLFEMCKPIWDKEFSQLIDVKVNHLYRSRMVDLFNNIVIGTGLFKPGHIAGPSYQTGPGSLEGDGFDFMTLLVFMRFITTPPTPTSLILFLHRHHATELELDDNMMNPRLSKDTYAKVINTLLVPLCRTVCNELHEPTKFYLSLLYGNNLLDQTEAQLRLFEGSRSSNKVNMWIASTSICCLLSDPSFRGELHRQILANIQTGRNSARRGSKLNEASRSLRSSGADQRPQDDGLVHGDGHDLDELDKLDEEFKRNRHALFLKENGYKNKPIRQR